MLKWNGVSQQSLEDGKVGNLLCFDKAIKEAKSFLSEMFIQNSDKQH